MKRSQLVLKDYAFQATAKAPSKKFPAVAATKKLQSKPLESNPNVLLSTVEDFQSPISSLALILPTGTRQQTVEQVGAANWLKFNAFKSTNTQSSIKITREAEIMGHALSSHLGRENLVLQMDFRRDDLPDVTALFADVLDGLVRRDEEQWGVYSREYVRKSNEWRTSMQQLIEESHANISVSDRVLDNLHVVAYRQGLAMPLYPGITEFLDIDTVLDFCTGNLKNQRLAMVGYGVDFDDLSNAAGYYLGQQLSGKIGGSEKPIQSKYHGGEHFSSFWNGYPGVEYAVAFEGSARGHSDYFTALVLKKLLGGNVFSDAALKYGQNHSMLAKQSANASVDTFSFSYSDSGLFGFYVKAQSANEVNSAVKGALQTLKSVASGSLSTESIGRSVALAKEEIAVETDSGSRTDKLHSFGNQILTTGKLHSTADLLELVGAVDGKRLGAFASKLLKSKPSISSLGDPFNVLRSDGFGL